MNEPRFDRRFPDNEPPILNYAPVHRDSRLHRGWYVVLLIVLAALVGVWSIFLGVMSLGANLNMSLCFIGAGAALSWATLGNLSAQGMRPRVAFCLLVLSVGIYIIAMISAHRIYEMEQVLGPRGSWTGHADFSIAALYRNIAAVATALSLGCLVYATIKIGLPERND